MNHMIGHLFTYGISIAQYFLHVHYIDFSNKPKLSSLKKLFANHFFATSKVFKEEILLSRHMGFRGPDRHTWANFHCFSHNISRVLKWKWSSPDMNQHLCGNPQLQSRLDPLCHNTAPGKNASSL